MHPEDPLDKISGEIPDSPDSPESPQYEGIFCILYYYQNIKGTHKTIFNIKKSRSKNSTLSISKENLILQHQSTSKDYLFVEKVSSSENSSQKMSDVDVSDVESLQDLHDPDQDGYTKDTIAENKNFYK